MARKSEPVTADELINAIDAVRDATRFGTAVAERLFRHLASGDIGLERERLFELLNAQKDLAAFFHAVFTLHTQGQDRSELKARLRAEIEGSA